MYYRHHSFSCIPVELLANLSDKTSRLNLLLFYYQNIMKF